MVLESIVPLNDLLHVRHIETVTVVSRKSLLKESLELLS